jgi:hypothetical protein
MKEATDGLGVPVGWENAVFVIERAHAATQERIAP